MYVSVEFLRTSISFFFLASVPLDKGSKMEDLVTKIRVRKGLKVNARNFLKAFVDHDICI